MTAGDSAMRAPGAAAGPSHDHAATLAGAAAAERAGRPDEAARLYRRAADAMPRDPWPLLRLAILLHGRGRFGEADAALTEALRRAPGDARLHVARGVVAEADGRPDEAIRCFREAARLEPASLAAHVNLGTLMRRAGRTAEAVVSLTRAAALAPLDPARQFALAVALHEAGSMDDVVSRLRATLTIAPDHANALYNLGITLPLVGRTDEAVDRLRKLLAVNPDSTNGRVRLGRHLTRLGRHEEAAAAFAETLRRDPTAAEALVGLAAAATRRRDHRAAARRLRRACLVAPDDGALWRSLGLACRGSGRLEAAIPALSRCLAGAEGAEQAERWLADLEDALAAGGRIGELARWSLGIVPRYARWIAENDRLDAADRAAIRGRIAGLGRRPCFSVVMPVRDPPPEFLEAAIASVAGQLYPGWQLCVADDGSQSPAVRAVLDRAAADPRVRLARLARSGGIAQATNAALALADGDFVVFLDHDDVLAEHALYLLAEELASHPDAVLLYSDEDKIDPAGRRFAPHFKSDWNPELLLAQNYVCHLMCCRRAEVVAVGGLRDGFEGAQDHDLALRIAERTAPGAIRHLPHILYHWRAIPGSTADDLLAKPAAREAARRAVDEHLERTGSGAAASFVEGDLRVRRPLPDPAPRVTAIVPTRDRLALLQRCVDGLLHGTDYPDLELVVVDNGSVEPATRAYLGDLAASGRARVVAAPGPFNYARLVNLGAAQARGELLCLLNNDVEPLAPDWLAELVAEAVRPEIGVAGAKLLYPDGTIQHAGVVLGWRGVAGHGHVLVRRDDPGYFRRPRLTQAVSAVTGACMVLRRAVLDRLGGLDEAALAVDFNDIDLCLKAGEAGLRVLYVATAVLWHHESASRGTFITPEKKARFNAEAAVMKWRWGDRLRADPYYNPNLDLEWRTFDLAFPSRAARPWRM